MEGGGGTGEEERGTVKVHVRDAAERQKEENDRN